MADANPTDSTPPVNRPKTRARHGLAHTPLYRVWQSIKQRCYNPVHRTYRHYGARGITICDRWRDSFVAFREDMGEPPGPRYEIERIENDGDYEPGNCRWATRAEQMRNTRRSRFITFRGRTMILADWAKELGISPNTLRVRLEIWGCENALSSPGPRGRMNSPMRRWNCRLITFHGETKCLTEWAESLGLKVATLHKRLKQWGVDRAFNTPEAPDKDSP